MIANQTDTTRTTAIIADDEPLLIQSLERLLQKVWPTLEIVATAANGKQAISEIMQQQPDVVFLDISMPGATGIQVAETIAEDWPETPSQQPPPLIVFVTAHNEYALDAFAAAAMDYLLKPVNATRLEKTVKRLQQQLTQPAIVDINQLGQQISQLLASDNKPKDNATDTDELRVIRASVGDVVKMIPVEEVVLFEAADKYITVYTSDSEALIREPLRKLLSQLNSKRFAQIHRGAIVNMDHVAAAVRDESGKVSLHLRGLDKQPVVSRMYKHLFQAM